MKRESGNKSSRHAGWFGLGPREEKSRGGGAAACNLCVRARNIGGFAQNLA